MDKNVAYMPPNIKEYVSKGTAVVNLVLLLFTICNGLLFWKYEATSLFYYNCFDLVLILISWYLLKKGNKKAYLLMTFLGIFLFMVLAVIYLGWEYGFQQYCIGLVASLLFSDYYMSKERRITKKNIFKRVWYCPLICAATTLDL